MTKKGCYFCVKIILRHNFLKKILDAYLIQKGYDKKSDNTICCAFAHDAYADVGWVSHAVFRFIQ